MEHWDFMDYIVKVFKILTATAGIGRENGSGCIAWIVENRIHSVQAPGLNTCISTAYGQWRASEVKKREPERLS